MKQRKLLMVLGVLVVVILLFGQQIKALFNRDQQSGIAYGEPYTTGNQKFGWIGSALTGLGSAFSSIFGAIKSSGTSSGSGSSSDLAPLNSGESDWSGWD